PLARRLASTLSGGQQKLVALGRALFCAHSLLLLDEPMEGVSPALSARMAEVVRVFLATKPGLAVLVAESDVNRVRLPTARLAPSPLIARKTGASGSATLPTTALALVSMTSTRLAPPFARKARGGVGLVTRSL